jgi:hypothetical protein
MNAFLSGAWHYIIGLAIIGAMCALAVTGVIAGTAATYVITGVGSALIGGGLVNAATPTVTTTTTPAGPTTVGVAVPVRQS